MKHNEKTIEYDFYNGFIQGYQMVRGTNVAIPGIPGQPGTPGNSTSFLEGLKAGLKRAGVDSNAWEKV